MAELVLYERGRKEAAFRVWPGTLSGTSIVQEAREYIFELRNTENPDSIELLLDGIPVEALRSPDSSTARWEWQPGFFAGSISASLRWPGRSESFEIVTDPDLRKLTRSDFNAMVREILEDTFALFSLSGFKTGIAIGTGGDIPPLARLEFIHSRLEELEQTIREIDKKPVRILRGTTEKVPLRRVNKLTGPELIHALKTGGVRPRPDGNRYSHQPPYLPNHVSTTRKSDGLNIREHQDIKACLRNWSSWLDVIAAKLAKSVPEDRELQKAHRIWVDRCRFLSTRLQNLLKLPLFAEITDRTAPVTVTPLYCRVNAYRKFFQIYRDMNLGIAQIVGDHLQMPLARTFDLYELWCFLRLVRAAVKHFGLSEIDASELFSKTSGGGLTFRTGSVRIPLKKGYALAFQRSYREYWHNTDLTGSFSRPMRPDISFNIPFNTEAQLSTEPEAERIIVIDAKYRIEAQLDDAITSLHTYRDALVQADTHDITQRVVVAAYLLTPHLASTSVDWKSERMPSRLFHPEYRTTFKFGAVTLRPGQNMKEIETALEILLHDVGLPYD